jgi:starch phosphorylase
MKRSMQTVSASFNTNRMLEEYTKRFYIPCMYNADRLRRDEAAGAAELARWREQVSRNWARVRILDVEAATEDAQPMGTHLPVHAAVELGDLATSDVLVEIYHGLLDADGRIRDGETATMMPEQDGAHGTASFRGDIPCRRSGLRGFTVRVVPRNEKYPLNRFETGLIHWWEETGAPDTEATDVPVVKSPAS